MAKKFLPKAKLTGDRKKIGKSLKSFFTKRMLQKGIGKKEKVLQASSCPYFIGFFEKSPFKFYFFATIQFSSVQKVFIVNPHITD